MNWLFARLAQLLESWKPWIVVPPWAKGIRVRLGKTAVELEPGPHFLIPGLDQIVLINTRLRITTTPAQTLPGSLPGRTRTVAVNIGYRIVDPVRSFLAYSVPEPAVMALAQSYIAQGAAIESLADTIRIELAMNGIRVEYVYASENVEVRTIRLLQGHNGIYDGGLHGGPPPPSQVAF